MSMTAKARRFSLAFSIAVGTAILYLPVLRGGFVGWDDAGYVVENYHIRALNLTFLRWAFTTYTEGNWHPLTWISHALDYNLWGLDPRGHHLTNLILHALVTLLVGLVAMRLVAVDGRRGAAPGSASCEGWTLTAGGVTAVLFGIHPVHVESVAWTSERKDLLCALFFLASVLAYARFAERSSQPGLRGLRAAPWAYSLSLLGCALALLSKPMAVSLPCVLFILDAYPFGRVGSWRATLRAAAEKIPFALLAAGTAALTVAAQQARGALAWTDVYPLPTRLLVGARALFVYLRKMALPIDLLPYYPYPTDVSLLRPGYLLPLVLGIAVTGMALARGRTQPLWLAAWSYYLVTLLPVLGIVQVGAQAMADRYAYLPSLAPFLVAGVSAAWAHARLRRASARGATVVAIAAALCVTAALSILTWRQIAVWRSSVSLWGEVIAKEPSRVPFAYNNRGRAYFDLGQLEEAIADYTKAIELSAATRRPGLISWQPYFNRGVALLENGEAARALADFESVLAFRPISQAYYMRGTAQDRLGRTDAARQDYERTIAMDPTFVAAYVSLGVLHGRAGAFERAMRLFEQAIAIDPNHPLAYANRGFAYAIRGERDRALRDFDIALRLDPVNPGIYENRARLHLRDNDTARALSDFRRACELGAQDACVAVERLRPALP